MTAVVLALLVGLYFLISGLQHKSATIHCQKIAQTPPPKQDFVGRGRSFYSFIYGNTAQFPPSGLSTAPAAAAPRSPYRHLELCGIALKQSNPTPWNSHCARRHLALPQIPSRPIGQGLGTVKTVPCRTNYNGQHTLKQSVGRGDPTPPKARATPHNSRLAA